MANSPSGDNILQRPMSVLHCFDAENAGLAVPDFEDRTILGVERFDSPDNRIRILRRHASHLAIHTTSSG